jgi:prephenate dehydrogenase
MGTSLGLAVRRAGGTVHLHEHDAKRLALAASLGAGEPCSASEAGPACAGFDVAVAAVPPAAVASVCIDLLRSGVAEVVTHLCSIQANVQAEVESAVVSLTHFVGGHPIAGRETSGPAGADAGLFRGRAWAVCAPAGAAPEAVAAVVRLARATGAVPVELAAAEHDDLLARVSHAPQLVASALAATLRDDPAAAALAGPGFRDVTRLADSPAAMWGEIVSANPTAVRSALQAVVAQLDPLRLDLDGDAVPATHPGPAALAEAVVDLVERGHQGRALLPGKHGRPARVWASAFVVVPDEPGALARLFAEIAEIGVNVEDLRLEHAPGEPLGAVELAVASADRDPLLTALTERGWAAVAGPEAPL